jgi:LuxR family maltose regulon positive regulatory protein
MAFIMHARVLITLGREYSDTTYVNDSLELLDRLLEMAQANNWETKVVKILALKSLAYDANGNKDLALSTLNQALSIAEPEGYIRSFVDEGPAMAKLLYEALSRKIAPEYVQKLLAAFPETATGKDTVTQSSQSTSEFIEPLSDRELEVLQLIAEGLSRQEIATRLVLSLNTVKTHARNIFSKLGVKNQMQAVGKARGRGLLDKD